ncbi:hypothetical protein G5714_017845 [Onychostoma macrolepis]|uniref:Uncharacterized protein n=1 Tax=Onychostoma macrolepis TaxID=369639 RepID=A0A7J6C3V9_9TELE|nr:hypothetical protein G5714_017845 [Onychostoma macrolepis]
MLLLGSVQWEREGRKEQEREGARERETGKEGDVSDWLCLLDSHRFSFVLLRESRQRAISSLSHLDHGQVASSVPLSRTLPPVSDTLPFPASKVRIKVKRLSFKASLITGPTSDGINGPPCRNEMVHPAVAVQSAYSMMGGTVCPSDTLRCQAGVALPIPCKGSSLHQMLGISRSLRQSELVTGLNTDAGQMAASISRQLSALKCGVKAGTCQDESHLSPCAFTSDSETDTGSPQRDCYQIPSYSLQSTCPVRKTLSQSGADKRRGTGGGAAVYRSDYTGAQSP